MVQCIGRCHSLVSKPSAEQLKAALCFRRPSRAPNQHRSEARSRKLHGPPGDSNRVEGGALRGLASWRVAKAYVGADCLRTGERCKAVQQSHQPTRVSHYLQGAPRPGRAPLPQ
jgi:hypothetical protein